MIELEDIRRAATALPGVEEDTHFNLPAFKVNGKVFVVLQEGRHHAILHVDERTAEATVAESPAACEAVSRNGGRIFVGLRVDLEGMGPGAFDELVERAWRHRAPKRMVAAHDRGSAR